MYEGPLRDIDALLYRRTAPCKPPSRDLSLPRFSTFWEVASPVCLRHKWNEV